MSDFLPHFCSGCLFCCLSQDVILLVLDCIDHMHFYNSAVHFAEAAGKDAGEFWEIVLNNFYELLGIT